MIASHTMRRANPRPPKLRWRGLGLSLLGIAACSTAKQGTSTASGPDGEAVGDAGLDASATGPRACTDDAACADGVCSSRGLCLERGACEQPADCRDSASFCSAAKRCIPEGSCAAAGDCDEGMLCDLQTSACKPGGCEEQSFELAAVPPNLLLVLDRSCSMTRALAGTGSDKWTPAVAAIDQLTTSFVDQARWGLVLFPDADADKCGQAAPSVELGAGKESAIQTLLSGALNKSDALYPDGPCVTNIADTLAQVDGLAALRDDGRTSRVILITDGAEAGCGNQATRDAESVATLHKLAADGTATFVVGFGSGTDKASMNLFAEAGGVPRADPELKYYQADDPAALETALGAIVASVVGCDFELASTPGDLGRVFVFLGDEKVARDAQRKDGWDYDAATNQVRLFGAACEALQSGTQADLEIVFTCSVD